MSASFAELEARVERLELLLCSGAMADAVPRSVLAIVHWVAAQTGMTAAEIVGGSIRRDVVRARFATCWGAREALGASASRIARVLGDRDHTSILNALQRAEHFRATDAAFRQLTNRLVVAFADAIVTP